MKQKEKSKLREILETVLVLGYLFIGYLVCCSFCNNLPSAIKGEAEPQQAIIPLLAAAAATAIGAGINAASNSKNNKANAAMAREQMAFDRQMWEDTNEYNLPINQIGRLRDAGINPNAAYNNGVDGITAQNQQTSANLANQKAFQTDAGTSMANALLQQQQLDIENKRVKVEQQRADTEQRKAEADIGYIDTQRDSLQFDLELKKEMKPETLRQYKLQGDTMVEKMKEVTEEIKLKQAQQGLINAQRITEEQMRGPQIQKILSESSYYRSLTELNKKNMELITQEIANMQLDGKIKEVEFYIADETKDHRITIIKNEATESGYQMDIAEAQKSIAKGQKEIQLARQGSDEFLAPMKSLMECVGEAINLGCGIATSYSSVTSSRAYSKSVENQGKQKPNIVYDSGSSSIYDENFQNNLKFGNYWNFGHGR